MKEQTQSEEQVQGPEAREILHGLLRNLEQVRAQRAVPGVNESAYAASRRSGEVWALDVAISAVKRRMR